MKKIIFFFTILTMAMILIGINIFKEKERKEISILLLEGNNEKIKAIIQGYSKKKDITIKIKETSIFDFISSIEEKHRQDEKVADIFLVINDWIGGLKEKGIISRVPENDLEDLLDIAKKGALYKTDYYMYPIQMETLYLYYNKKYVKDLPDSVEGILSLAKQIRKTHTKEGIVMPVDEFYYHFPFYTYIGGEKKELLNMGDKLRENIKTEIKLIKENMIYADVFVAKAMFESEEAAMYISGNWELNKSESYKFDFGYKLIKDKKYRPFVGVKGLAIYKKSKNKDEARKLLRYLLEYSKQSDLEKAKHIIPVHKKVLEESNKVLVKEFMKKKYEFEIMPTEETMKIFWLKSNLLLNRVFWNETEIEQSVDEIFGEKDDKN